MNDSAFSRSLRLSAALLLVGQLLYIAVTQLHTGGDANNHSAIFAAYASSETWAAVHVGQFAALAILLAGLLALVFVLDSQAETARWEGRLRGRFGGGRAGAVRRPPGGGRGGQQAGRRRVGERPGGREGSALRER